LLKLEEYVEFFDIFKEAARDISFEVNNLNGKSDTIVKWLEENKLESMDILPILNLPKFSESDEQQLQQLRHDFEKISENNKKIIDNNFTKDRLTEQETNEHRLFKGEEQCCSNLEHLVPKRLKLKRTWIRLIHLKGSAQLVNKN
jgi:hydroxymethylpyrimidine pyrophosphatase-like HAD family hydrolase